MKNLRKLLGVFLAAVILLSSTSSTIAMAASSQGYDRYYYMNSIKVDMAKQDLKNRKLNNAYVVVLDSGLEESVRKTSNIFENRAYYANAYVNDSIDYAGHGTEVSSVIAKITNRLGDNNIKIIPYKVSRLINGEPIPRIDAVVTGINYTVNEFKKRRKLNVAAINMSISFDKLSSDELKSLTNAVKYANDNGITIVIAAGNQNRNIYRYPAMLNNVITVGATDNKNNRASFSNYGNNLDLVAPGKDLGVYYGGDCIDSGTSFSAPMVTTTVALMKSLNPNLKPSEIESILKATATDLGAKGKDNYYGYGLLNIEKAVNYVITKTLIVPVTGVKLDRTNLSLKINSSTKLTATVLPANAANKAVIWSSNNSSIASVDQTGKIVTRKAGKATISVTTKDGKKSVVCIVNVIK